MFRTTAAASVLAASLWIAPASAVVVDTFDTYTVNGSYTNFFDPPITGTLTVDLTTERVTAVDITTGFGSFTSISAQGTLGQDYVVDLNNGTGTIFNLVLDTRSTLFSGNTAAIDPRSSFWFETFLGPFPCLTCGDFAGSLTISDPSSTSGVSAAVPEPSTWAMMILGFLGVGIFTYRRRSPKFGVAAS
jgi:PEP-CTERM motif